MKRFFALILSQMLYGAAQYTVRPWADMFPSLWKYLYKPWNKLLLWAMNLDEWGQVGLFPVRTLND